MSDDIFSNRKTVQDLIAEANKAAEEAESEAIKEENSGS